MVPTIDGRILETDYKWSEYCKEHGIKNPFWESQDKFKARCHDEVRNGIKCTIIDAESPEEITWRTEWVKRRDEYLRLEHTFRLWDFHFWMDWSRFQEHLKWSKDFADTSIYMPCDTAERQCSMACAYFGAKCPRVKEEVKNPIKGLEGEYKYDDTYEI